MKQGSLKLRLLFLIWGILGISLTIPGLYFINILQKQVKQDAISNVKKEFTLIRWILLRRFHKKTPPANMDAFIKELGKEAGDRITYILEDGVVIADSKVPEGKIKHMDNHATRPEIIQARHRGWGSSIRFSGTLKKQLIYYAEKISSRHLPPGYLRVARPYSRIAEELSRIKTGIWQITLACFLLSGFLVFLFISNFTRKFDPLIEVTRDLARGRPARRIASPGKEFDPLVNAINTMAEGIENNLNIINLQKKELRAILDGIDVGIAAIDKEGNILQHNLYFEQICKLPHDEIINRNISELLINKKLFETIENALNKKIDIKNVEIKIKENFYTIKVISKHQYGNISALVIFHDITDKKKVENMRRDFVANVSHELRTPLTSIRGYTELLLENENLAPEDIKKFLKIIQKNTEDMVYLIDNILNLARIESGKIKFHRERINIKELSLEAWSKYEDMAGEKDIEFVPPQRDIFAVGDREKLLIVFNNLIHNSIKFLSPKGRIEIVIEENKGEIKVGVKDNGPGIPGPEQSRIFERFYQVKRFRPKGIKGSGLGLSICRNIISGLGGKIWVESPPKEGGRGCIIWFTLQREKGNEQDRSQEKGKD